MTPLKRFIRLLSLDKKDILQLFFYAIFSGLISLSLPLGIQAIINFIQAGRISVSWIVLVIVVVTGVAFAGFLSLMQLRISESLQQKIFIRSSFEFAYRIPKLKFSEISNTHNSEIANRFFDTLTIQKGTSKLVLDFSAAVLQILFGVVLLSIYHIFFVIFGILLITLLYLIFRFSYAKGLETSLKESKQKYKVANWLLELVKNNFTFKNPMHFNFALEKNNKLVTEYLAYREKHFRVLKRQFSQLILFKVIITAGLLLIGGFLVISQQMNIGQFVAAEIVILMVISSVEKIIIGLETLYDVVTSVEKIGQITDLEIEDSFDNELDKSYFLNLQIQLENVSFKFHKDGDYILSNINLSINQGDKIFINGDNGAGKTTFIRLLSGLYEPSKGNLVINNDSVNKMTTNQYRNHFGSILTGETLFEGTILENICFNNKNIDSEKLKWALDGVQLTTFIKSLPLGLNTIITSDGIQLSSSNIQKVLLVRAILKKPRILFLENALDKTDFETSKKIIDFLMDKTHNWTIIAVSKNNYYKDKCNRIVSIANGTITNNLKNI